MESKHKAVGTRQREEASKQKTTTTSRDGACRQQQHPSRRSLQFIWRRRSATAGQRTAATSDDETAAAPEVGLGAGASAAETTPAREDTATAAMTAAYKVLEAIVTAKRFVCALVLQRDEGNLQRGVRDGYQRFAIKKRFELLAAQMQKLTKVARGPWDDGGHTGIRSIAMSYDRCIDAIRLEYDRNGLAVAGERHGDAGGNRTIRTTLH
ncbi:hypothetical protein ABZP36_028741 [Zizania latifolia]